MRFRLLPEGQHAKLGYVWLVYLGFPLVAAFVYAPEPRPITATLVAIAAFLPLYFWGFWTRGARALLPIAGISTIGVLLQPWNQSAGTFFIYAAAFAGVVGPPRVAVLVIAAVELLALGGLLLGYVEFQAWAWTAPFAAFIGGVNVYSIDVNRKLARAQEHAKHLAVLAERERIGRDLHDLLGHTLSVIALKSELAAKIAPRDAARSVTEIEEVARISRDALAEVRQAVLSTRVAKLDDELTNAGAVLDAAGIAVGMDVSSARLPPDTEATLAFALREAVTNVVRHSSARRCEIRLTRLAGSIELDVRDDGVGGDVSDGFGLSGMRARVRASGGEVRRDGTSGTRLVVTVPLVELVEAKGAGA